MNATEIHRSKRWRIPFAALFAFAGADDADASCNVIPAATKEFRGALGSANRPFASPGDVVELRVRPAICDGTSTGFVDLDGDGSRSDDHVVTVIFVPPSGSRNATVLAESCAGIDLSSCTAALGGGTAQCVPVNGLGEPPGIVVTNAGELQVRFPDTDARLASGPCPGDPSCDDDRTFAGPAKIVVTRRGAPLVCGVATSRCADLGGTTATNGVVACLDELYAQDGTCRETAAQVDSALGHFTALPPPNDLERMVNAPGITEVHLTTDSAGNLLIPMDYTGLLIRIAGRPVPLLARTGTSIEAFSGGGQKVSVPSNRFLGSFSPEGIILPPVFTPLSDPSNASEATLFGSLDAPRGVLRLARQACVGGTREGLSCTSNAVCSGGGSCTGPIFELRDRYASGVGPVLLVAAGGYTALRDTPITLESVAQTQASGSFAFVSYEGVDGVDRNGDGDAFDFVLTLRDPESGLLRPIGPGGSEGRAVVQAREGRFAFPALETTGDLVAFLESEPNQGGEDTNDNGEVFDSILRIFRLGATQGEEVTSAPVTAEATRSFAGSVGAWLGEAFAFRSAEAREAARQTTRSSPDSGGGNADAGSDFPSISSSGRFVAFPSVATDLVSGDTNDWQDVFVRDRDTDANGIFDEPGEVATTRVSVDSAGAQGNNTSYLPAISADGRFVAFASEATNLVPGDTNGSADVFVHDRDSDADGVFDEPGWIATTRVSVDGAESQANSYSFESSISADGRFVAFQSGATNLVPGDTNARDDVFLRDLLLGTTERVSLSSAGGQGNDDSILSAVSADGRLVAFQSYAGNLVPNDANGAQDVFVRDRLLGTTECVSVDASGVPGDAGSGSSGISISADGRFVAFDSGAGNLVPGGDTNGSDDVFVRDRLLATTERVSVDSAGIQADAQAVGPSLSADGRLVAFQSYATNLVPGDGNGGDVFVHDRNSGATVRASLDDAGTEGDGLSERAALSGDGRSVAFASVATNLVAGDTNGLKDVFVRGLDTTDLAPGDRTGDGVLDDTLLRVADASGVSAVVGDLCPAALAASGGGRVAFLRPEAAGASAAADCVQVSADLNGDGDLTDDVVQIYDGAAVHNLRCPARNVALSATRLAALVSECEQAGAETGDCPSGGTDFSGDGDAADLVLAVRDPAAAAPSSCVGWGPTALAGKALDVSGDVVALLTAEADLGPSGTPLNGDGDAQDRVLRLVDGATGSLIPIVDDQAQPVSAQEAEDFVMGPGVVAFRTRESAQSNASPPACSLNGDADCDDEVLQVYLLATGERISTGQSAVPCPLPECDPRKPYRVSSDTVRFLTYESDQGQDLDQDGDTSDLLVQVFNVQSRATTIVAEIADPAQIEASTGVAPVPGTGADPLASPSETSAAEQTWQVAVAQGRCVEPSEAVCNPAESTCLVGQFCFVEPGAEEGVCVRDAGASCYADRPVGEQGCLAGTICVRDFVVLAIADRDADQVPDALDDCPDAANTDQTDADQDGVGDACDLQTCGNGAVQLDEQCDDGDLDSGDGCDANCRITACGNGIVTAGEACDDGNGLAGDGCSAACQPTTACNDGTDNDGDGAADFGADPGCANAADDSETSLALPCDDGQDNDGDDLADAGEDPGCFNVISLLENPQCQDGIQNDLDGLIDWDGGASAGVPPGQQTAPDPDCVDRPYRNRERTNACGLGFELVFVLGALAVARRRLRPSR